MSARAGALAAELLEDALQNPQLTPQADEGVTYAAKIGPEDRELDWTARRGAAQPRSGRSRRTSAPAASCTADR